MVERDKILKLFEVWVAALKTADPDKVVACYAKTAVLIPTVSNDVRTDHAEIRSYFVEFIKEKKPKGAELNPPDVYIRPLGDFVINSGIYTFYLGDDGAATQARYTFVYGSDGLIVEHHSSLLYKEQTKGKAVFDKLRVSDK